MLLEKMYELKEGNDSKLWKDCIDILIRECEGMDDTDIMRHLYDISRYSCENIVGEMIPTHNCRQFVIQHIDEVLDLYNESRNEWGGVPEELDVEYLAHLAVNMCASQLIYVLGDYMQELQR